MNDKLSRYKILDSIDIENIILRFLQTSLSVEFLPGVKYSKDPERSTLVVDIANNVANKEENQCPAVILKMGSTVYQEMLIDHAALYSSGYEAAQTIDPDSGKVDPHYKGVGKKTYLEGSTPVTIEVRAFSRIECTKLATRLVKVLFAFAKALESGTNTRIADTIQCGQPTEFKVISKTAWKSNIAFNTEHISTEIIPEIKNLINQFFVTIKSTKEATAPIEITEVIK